MLHYSQTVVEKMKMVGGALTKPVPFPALHPTHIMVKYGDGRVYVGKRFRGLFDEVVCPVKRKKLGAWIEKREAAPTFICEFDKKHIVWKWGRDGSGLCRVSEALMSIYHPSVVSPSTAFSASVEWFDRVIGDNVRGYRSEGKTFAFYMPSTSDPALLNHFANLIEELLSKKPVVADRQRIFKKIQDLKMNEMNKMKEEKTIRFVRYAPFTTKKEG